jgi:LmbE family N-acetylglucosaminyl deacetylase
MVKIKTVLAIGAHPDDLELLCAGTLARYAELGATVYLCHATDGAKGGLDGDPENIREQRRVEADAAAAVIGAVSLAGPFRDGELETGLDSRRWMIDLIRHCAPDVVLAHHPHDYHPDHKAVSSLAMDAIYHVAIPHLITEHPALTSVPLLYFFDTVSGIGFLPEEYVDISSVIDKKKRMMAAHASQLDFVRKHHKVDFIDMIDTTGRYRGYQCNTQYAEGFIASQSWPRGTTQRVLP